jgi:hypothetical protein
MANINLLNDLTVASMPESLATWRVVFANTTRARVLREVVTLGWADTTTEAKARAVFGADGQTGIASLSLGYPAAFPVSRGEIFVLDMKWYRTPPLVPLSVIVQKWEAFSPGLKVVQVGVAPRGEDAATAVYGRAAALDAAGKFMQAESPVTAVVNAGRTALSTLKLGFWAVIVAGGVYLVSKARSR